MTSAADDDEVVVVVVVDVDVLDVDVLDDDVPEDVGVVVGVLGAGAFGPFGRPLPWA